MANRSRAANQMKEFKDAKGVSYNFRPDGSTTVHSAGLRPDGIGQRWDDLMTSLKSTHRSNPTYQPRYSSSVTWLTVVNGLTHVIPANMFCNIFRPSY